MINISNLTFSYGNNNLFDNLKLEIKTGKIYGLLGKNGAGKTTLLKIISGLIFPKRGSCLILDSESKYRIPNILKEIYFIPESYSLPEITIEQYEKLYSPFYDRFNSVQFYEKVKDFELERNKKVNTFSYGQKKEILAIAFGIASKCKILIFDEPTNGLDIPSQRAIRKHLAECVDEARVIILSTHHVKEMENIFDTITILDNGKIIFKEDPDLISQKFPDGYNVLIKNKGIEELKIDIEFLFNAILKETQKINSVFQEQKF